MKKVVLALLIAAVLFAGLVSCAQAQKSVQTPAQKPASPALTLLYFYGDY